MIQSTAILQMGGTGGALGWDGDMRLQALPPAQRVVMSAVMPGQNTEALAHAIMEFTSWCAALKAIKTSRREGTTHS